MAPVTSWPGWCSSSLDPAGQPHPDHVESQRPCRGAVPLQMNNINSWKCFHKGVFPLLASISLKNTDLEVNSLCCCKGANIDFLPHPPPGSSASSTFLPAPPMSPGRSERARLQGWRVPHSGGWHLEPQMLLSHQKLGSPSTSCPLTPPTPIRLGLMPWRNKRGGHC